VYAWNGTNWNQRGTDIDGEAAGDGSGYSVSMSSDGTVLAIGAYRNDGINGTDSGHVRVYEWNTSSWQQKGFDIDGEAANDDSGRSVSLSGNGNVVAIGAPNNSGTDTNAGNVRVYEYYADTSPPSWQQMGDDIDGEAAGDESGWSVSLSSDGTVLAIGAPGNGSVRVYEWNGSSWQRKGTDIDGEAADESGWSVSLSSDGTIVAIGAPYNDGNGSNSGHVRVYEYMN
jgi:hypothetical protein